MSTEKVDLFNLTLFLAGHNKRISDPDDLTSPEAFACSAIYNFKREALLTMALWGFAVVETTLGLTGNDFTGWEYEYHYPDGCLRAVEISRLSKNLPKTPFQKGSFYNATTGEEGLTILTNEEEAKLIYIRNVTNLGLFSPTAKMALASFMAVDVIRALGKNTAKGPNEMLQLFQYYMAEAIRVGEAEAVDEESMSTWIDESY